MRYGTASGTYPVMGKGVEHGSLPFPDVEVTKTPDGTIGYRVYRKLTLTDMYLNADSHHRPARKVTVRIVPALGARAVSNRDS